MSEYTYAHEVLTVICDGEHATPSPLLSAAPGIRSTSVRYVCKVCGTVWVDAGALGIGPLVAKEGDREKCRLKTAETEPATQHREAET